MLLDKNNKIAFAVVFAGGVHEVNLNKHVAVPFAEQRIKADQAEKSLILNLTLQELGQEPEFKLGESDAARFEYAISAESLIGLDVFGKNGTLLGEVKDLIFNNNNDVKYVIVVTSGIVNISDKLVAAPYHELKINKAKESVTLDVTSQELEDAPGFQYRRPRP
ncbi:MAG TPA: PRC-barrel domain-containing protein [Nitrosomonas sp.]|nr:PRC-barrel domain-containing protein [Nitrosomonas sp.]